MHPGVPGRGHPAAAVRSTAVPSNSAIASVLEAERPMHRARTTSPSKNAVLGAETISAERTWKLVLVLFSTGERRLHCASIVNW